MERRRILPINSGAISTLAVVAITLCLACSPVTLKSSAEDGGDTSSDANTPEVDAGEMCQGVDDDRCEGDTYRRCNSAGVLEDTVCELGCSSDGGPHCRQLHPALLGIPISMACETADDFAPSLDVLFDTGTGAIIDRANQSPIRAPGMGQDADTGIGFQVLNQNGGPDVGVFTFGALTVPSGNHLVRGPRAAAFIACGRLEVHGLIDVTANRTVPGPGGFTPGGGPGVGGDGQQEPLLTQNPGGGGGGHGGAGGVGGPGANVPTGGTRGVIYGNVSALPLVGGSSGGRSGGGNLGGAGGGVMYLASASAIFFSGGGTINAGGGGGSTGPSNSGGGGGGAGGTIFLDAPVVELVGGATLAVNGGGGAIANQQDSQPGDNGQAGQGPAGPIRGAADLSAAGDSGANDGGGGGGGGCGRMRFLSASGDVDLSDTAISPRAEVANVLNEAIVSQDLADIK